MKTLIIFFLLSISLLAQEVSPLMKGGGSYLYTVATDTNQIVNGDLYLYGNFTKTLSDTGAYSFRPFIVWKYTTGTYDSSAALRIANSFLVRVNAPILDTTGTYYASMLYRTKNGNWIYSRGADSSFTTPVTIVPPDTVPVQFAIYDSTGAEFNTLVESYSTRLTGLDSCWFDAGGKEFKINGGAWRTAGIKVHDEDVFYLRNTTSLVCTTAVNTTVTAGGISDVYSITTKLDKTPDDWTFTDKTGAEVSTQYISDQKTASGLHCPAPISINGGQFQINSNAWRSSSTTINNGDLYRVRNTSSPNYNDSTLSILTIDIKQDTYTITTRPDTTPTFNPLFTDITNAHLDSLHYSSGAVLTSLDSCCGSAGLDTFRVGAYGTWMVDTIMVYGNDTIYLKNVSNNTYSSSKLTVFSAGGTSDTWSITTIPDPNVPTRYVDGSLTGTDNQGQSWADAYEDFSQIEWNELANGGIIYISGSVDSLVYAENMTIGASGSWGNYIEILPGKYSPSPSGHDGKVIIDHNYSGGQYGISILGSRSWIKIKGLTIRHTGNSGIYMYANAAFANPSHIWVDSCNIYEVNANECIEILGYYSGTANSTNMALLDTLRYIHHVELSRNIMYTHSNRNMPECNIIYGHLTGWLYIHHNYMWQRNYQEGGNNHIDCIQLSYSNHSFRIYNNIMSTDSCVTGHVMIIGPMSRSSDYADTVVVYNNYIYSGGSYNCQGNYKQEILWREPEGGNPGGVQHLPLVYSINNDVVSSNGLVINSSPEGRYNPRESNNIIASFGQNGAQPSNYIGFWNSSYNTTEYKQVDSNKTNLAYMSWGDVDFGNNRWRGAGGSPTDHPSSWSDFINNWGGTGVNADPDFANNFRITGLNSEPYELNPTSPAINAGTDMTYILQKFEYLPMFYADKDILGNLIVGNRDIGCFEVQP